MFVNQKVEIGFYGSNSANGMEVLQGRPMLLDTSIIEFDFSHLSFRSRAAAVLLNSRSQRRLGGRRLWIRRVYFCDNYVGLSMGILGRCNPDTNPLSCGAYPNPSFFPD
jgi:hypothetical protein